MHTEIGTRTTIDLEENEKPIWFLVAAYSSISQGTNIYGYNVVVINPYDFKPRYIYSNAKDIEELREARAEEQALTIIQNIGRILRDNERKVIIVEPALNIQ